MKAETLKECKNLFYRIIWENDNELKTLSKIAVTTFDIMFERHCKSKNKIERSEMYKWIRETLLKYCIAMYDDDKQFVIKDDGTVVI